MRRLVSLSVSGFLVMPKLQFIGRVLPTQIPLTLPPSTVEFGPSQGPGISGTYRIHVANSIINIECEAETVKAPERFMLLANALALVRVAVNLASFAVGHPMQVQLDTVIDETGNPSPLIVKHSILTGINTAVATDNAEAFNSLCHEIISGEPYAFDVLNDLRISINEPVFSVIHLNRAIEGIKQDISGAAKDDKSAWETMRATLNIDENYLRHVTNLSKGARHARVDPIQGKDALEAVRRAWTITNRYLEYIKRKRTPLPLTEFPLLQEQP
jgi:hypothetical protein